MVRTPPGSGDVATRVLGAVEELLAAQLGQVIGGAACRVLLLSPARALTHPLGHLGEREAIGLRWRVHHGVEHVAVTGVIQIDTRQSFRAACVGSLQRSKAP